MGQRTAAGIVLYQPNIDRLRKNINAIYNQVDFVYCYNNGVQNIDNIQYMVRQYPNIILVGKGNNDGIAKAINQIAEEAIDNNVEWLITLDQDSICPEGMISSFLKYVAEKKVGAICPLVIDKRRPAIEMPKDEISEVDFCITSGCFMNLEIFKKLGGMDEYLFIGLVDNEYSYRLVSNRFRIIRVNSVVLDHELGNLTPSKFSAFFLRFGDVINSDKIKALSYKRKVSAFRLYYATRNCIYLSKKYPGSGVAEFTKAFAIKNGLINILRSHFRFDVIKAFYRGLREG